jgi:hypothetical protein
MKDGKYLRKLGYMLSRPQKLLLARATTMPLDPEKKLSTPVPSVYLFEDFVSPQEERYLLSKIEELGGVEIEGPEGEDPGAVRKYKDKGTAAGWRTVKGRR